MPLDTVKKRLQVQGFETARMQFGRVVVYRGSWDCVVGIVRAEGVRGLYKGSLPAVVKSAATTAVTLVVFDACMALLGLQGRVGGGT